VRVAAVAHAVTECLGHAYSDRYLTHAAAHDYRAHPDGNAEYRTGPNPDPQHDGNAEHGAGPHATTQHVRHAHALRNHAPRDHVDIEHRHGQAFKHHQDTRERHANGLGHLAKGDAHADRHHADCPDHDG
jgi:hypothetical protein